MNTRLQFIQEWEVLAKEANYRPCDLAFLCQISLRTLERHFQKHYNVTVGQWLRELRLREAYDSLKEGKSVKEVAFDFGYKQVSHFSREFKAHFGIAPSLLLTATPAQRFPGFRQISPTEPQMVLNL
jgi:transcriptional regulator GlxA family with amidase domain